MDILLTLPPHFAGFLNKHIKDFPSITAVYSDPEDHKLGSGGGTVNVLWKHGIAPASLSARPPVSDAPLRRIIIHSDGQSRRLPAYATVGKSFIPFPVFKWSRGQRIDQTLFDVQLMLLEKILSQAPEGQNTLVVSGDSLVRTDAVRFKIPQADVVCAGVWAQPETASKHGVFVVPRHDPTRLQYMLQKPSIDDLQELTGNAMYLLDAGIWILSDRAVAFLFKETGWNFNHKDFKNDLPGLYDLYSDFGKKLGEAPGKEQSLSVRILPLDQAEFYHFGSNADMLRSTRLLHDRVLDQREIWHKKIKPSPEIFVQNASTGVTFNTGNASIWIENSCIPAGWSLHDHHILTGIPENEWNLNLPAGVCLDFIPVGNRKWCIRPYGFHDAFRGKVSGSPATWLNQPVMAWFESRGFSAKETAAFADTDIYECSLFPLIEEKELDEGFLRWLIDPSISSDDGDQESYRSFWLACTRLSCHDIIMQTNHARLLSQRKMNLRRSLSALAINYQQSVFYQLDLDQMASQFRTNSFPLPPPLPTSTDVMTQVHDLMFRSAYLEKSSPKTSASLESQAFGRLREGMIENLYHHKANPVLNVHHDQVLWGRSPVRLDLAGGWTDTPPYCIIYGGKVVNMAVELNGQPPIQVYIHPTTSPEIVIRSIDLGVSEVVHTYDEMSGVSKVGSAFAIPKAALMLAGFHPGFSAKSYKNLRDQLHDFGGGLDISLMVAVPKGSGLGTSSILAATLLGGLSECCTLGWDRHETAYRTLLLEQMLTTGGGWQDQLGGIFEGIKLLESTPGLVQRPGLSWVPEHLFTRPESKELILLYYTGITRVAKHILTDIVKGMFLNSSHHLGILSEMKHHAIGTYDAIRHHDWNGLTEAIRYSWELNQRLDSGTNPPEVEGILRKIRDHAVSYKLLGAGGGGYIMIFAKDLDATYHIRTILRDQPPNRSARFVEWRLSPAGLEITKS
jgi:galactokinase/mevalonate kinase-like predicted kinase